jgi:positive regulator of sigma E activity
MLLQLFQHSAFAAIIFVRVMQQACQLLVQQKHHAACSSCACRVPAAP